MRIGLLLCKGFEEIEVVTPVDIFRRANVHVDMIGLEEEFVESSRKIIMKADCLFKDLTFKRPNDFYDVLLLPGGEPATTTLEKSEIVKQLILSHIENKKKIAAICAAPRILSHMGLLKGRKSTGYPLVREKMVQKGAIYLEDPVVVDGDFITSRGPATAPQFAFKILEEFGLKRESLEWQEKMLYC